MEITLFWMACQFKASIRSPIEGYSPIEEAIIPLRKIEGHLMCNVM